jgi:single-strand DNA-binding protein
MDLINRVIVVGNLTRDAEAHDLSTGQVFNMGVAVNERFTNKAGNIEERPMFIDVALYDMRNKLGWMLPYLKKGAKVTIDGKLRYETWTDKVTGEKRSKHSIVAHTIEMEWPKREQSGQSYQSQSYQSQSYQQQDAYEDDQIPF